MTALMKYPLGLLFLAFAALIIYLMVRSRS